jgi:hypothetical protein
MHARLSVLLPLALASSLVACDGDMQPSSEADLADVHDAATADVGADAEVVPMAAIGEWEPAFDAAPYGAFMSVWGPAPTEVYAVGGQPRLGEGSGDGVAFRFDGTAWSELDIPEGPMLNWVHGTQGTVWMVGEAGRYVRLDGGEVAESGDVGVDVPLWGVWAAAPDDVWAVGGNARARDGLAAVFHYDGADWSQVALPELDRPGVAALFKVWGTSPDNVFAVGMVGAIVRWDGTAWTQLPSGVGDDLVSLWGRGPDDVVAVGGRGNGVLGRWDGAAFTFERLPGVPGLNGSWMASDGTVLTGGVGGRVLRVDAGFEFERLETPVTNPIHAVFGFDSGPFFAVGGSLLSSPPYVGDVLIAQ